MYCTSDVISNLFYSPPVPDRMRRKSHTKNGCWSILSVVDLTAQPGPDYSLTGEIKGGGKMREDVQTALEKIRPALQADGGDVELVDVEDGIVSVRLTGACGGCPMSTLTLKMGIERVLREQVPDVREVVSV